MSEPPIRLFVSDLDGTLLGKPDATSRFARCWRELNGRSRPSLCYNTGRLLDDALTLLERVAAPSPDHLICGVGTQIFDLAGRTLLKEFTEVLEEDWDYREGVRAGQAATSVSEPV